MSLVEQGPPPAADTADVVAALRRVVGGEVDDGTRRRAEYSSDASNYRVPPTVVVFPRDVDDALAVVDTARETGTPLTSRGAGTSVAGNAIGTGIVMDFSRHLSTIDEIDPSAQSARVQPGVVMARLQDAAAPHGLRFGPDPSTWTRCTIGGMIGNNACGSHSLAYGRTVDNVIDLDVIDARGRRFDAASGFHSISGMDAFVSSHMATIRTELGRFGRQVSGYSLEHLLPENGRSLAKALVGTEGTCAVVLGATVRLVAKATAPVLVVLGYPSMIAAADDVPNLLGHRPDSIEGLDARLVNAVRDAKGAGAVSSLPDGAGWLLVEVSGEDARDAAARATRLIAGSAAISHRTIADPVQARPVWRIREDGVGLAGRTAAGKQAWPGFEDAAVPPERLGSYLRDMDELFDQHGLSGMPYGHFGDGCIHVRLDIPLEKDGSALRAFMTDAARLVAGHGGSLSGEHGDGRARSELLPLMYSPAAIEAFEGFKRLFDPDDLFNPGVIVHPASVDADLRRPQALPLLRADGMAFAHDGGDFTQAVHRCVGIGKCRADNTAAGGFMCPSYQATTDEKDSTRGRARVLQEMLNGGVVEDGWASEEVHDALDLCLSCKACASDCPAGVDMAAYKSESLHRRYRGRLRPITHYVLGWLPRWARLASPFAPLVNAVLKVPGVSRLALWAGGMDTRRSIPAFARRSFRASQRRLRRRPPTEKRVLLWTDSFSDSFSPEIPTAAIDVLADAGITAVLPETAQCCGLTWISTGQLTGARRRLSALVDAFHPAVAAGVPIVGLEPSCTAVLRSDLLEILPNDPRARDVAQSTFTLAEVLTGRTPVRPDADWQPPTLGGTEVLVQPHCHQHAVMGFTADAELLERMGATVTELAGCCGLAGNFGMERGHYDVSVAVAENALLPALRDKTERTVFLADGFSCRTQADQLADTPGIHLAQLISGAHAPRTKDRP
ncbi:FAD-binding and (Fe-S)-binding domain-containing protein [Microbacterium sp.]|uniref:FAD-binding and (Fe-S)-binding domain-containing protein n=1 Tax=Microbacterium sp. TaxID=51671 RepID=UPI00262CB566|nr:FAD-binding and (Fe-S)-binding domain-containing protein [Microbacterium sp.]